MKIRVLELSREIWFIARFCIPRVIDRTTVIFGKIHSSFTSKYYALFLVHFSQDEITTGSEENDKIKFNYDFHAQDALTIADFCKL